MSLPLAFPARRAIRDEAILERYVVRELRFDTVRVCEI